MSAERISRSPIVLDLDDHDAATLAWLLRQLAAPLDACHHELLDRVADQLDEATAEDAAGDA
tara:strand:+ start:54 stop:239 length:186 start_codon:yes stop_codon:yes gene_type:complete